MRFINTIDLKKWAETVHCKYNLPHLIRKLILATIDNKAINNIHFPYGEEVYTGGFDGELTTELSSIFVPSGESIWEFGTTNSKKAKADEDYEKRKKNPLDKNPTNTTYVNINAKKYRDKNDWIKEKKLDGFWKDVLYIDAVDIEQWLELTPTVELWLAEQLRKPTLGIYTINQYWKLWSESGTITIVPEILLGNSRLNEVEKVKSFLSGQEKVLYVKSITTDEASVFPIAVIKQLDDSFQLNTVVIDNRDSFHRFIQTDSDLVIIAKFNLDSIDLHEAIEKGHKVIVPISLSEEVNRLEKIHLPIVSRENFDAGLKKMGIDHEQVNILTRDSGRNISVLKRLLNFAHSTKPKYTESVGLRDIVPMLFLNRFSENFEGDKQIVEKLSGKSYSDFNQFLKVLVTLEDSPVYFVNNTYRLVSPTDTWLFFAKYATEEDFANFQQVCLEVLSEVHHKYKIPLSERGLIIQTSENRTKYSSDLHGGLCETLVVIAVFGESYGINSTTNAASFVDNIAQKIFEMDIAVWRSMSTNLKLLAEASPTVFLRNLERIIRDESISSFFEVENGFLRSSNELFVILRCLDICAWFPEHLLKVSTTLCDLILISASQFPGNHSAFNSLVSIFRPWYPQTNTAVEDRMKILDVLVKKYPDQAYSLMYNLLESNCNVAIHTPRPKWRLFSELREIKVSYNELQLMRNFSLDKIIDMSRNNFLRVSALIQLIDDINWNKIDSILKVIEDSISFDDEERKSIYHHFRKLVGKHRSYHHAEWALPSEIVNRVEQTALKFKPDTDVLSESYLFEENYPQFMEGRKVADFTVREEEITSRRLKFVDGIIEAYGIDKIFELACAVNDAFQYGHILSLSDKITFEDKIYVCRKADAEDAKIRAVVQAYLQSSENRGGLQSYLDILPILIDSGLSVLGCVVFLDSFRDSLRLWTFIEGMTNKEIEKQFWIAQNGFVYTNSKPDLFFALEKLLQYNKNFTFLNTLGWAAYSLKEELTSEDILSSLEKVPMEQYNDSSTFDHSHFVQLLELLYTMEDYDIDRAAKIEIKFLSTFMGGSTYSPKPKNLYKLMSQSPLEYFALLSEAYLPENDDLKEKILKERQSNPDYKDLIMELWEILNSFDFIPSLKEDGTLDGEVLKKWICEVRTLAKENHRTAITDDCIGGLLGRYPINLEKKVGFPLEIYDVVEEVGTEEILTAFSIQNSNNFSYTVRGPFQGGTIERLRADFFESLFEETKFTHPNVSLIFKELTDEYRSYGKKQDEIALKRSL